MEESQARSLRNSPSSEIKTRYAMKLAQCMEQKEAKSNKTTKAVEAPKVTPVKKSTNNKDTPIAPNASMQTRYRTRSNTTTQVCANENTSTKKNLAQEFDAAFFEESSIAWNQNKKKLGNGMYAYRTRSTSRK
jgi:hypothetical protein